MINAITTNLTSFFREAHHFSDMAKVFAATQSAPEKRHRIRIWSAACSTGEEPYSIAIAAVEAGFGAPGNDLRILATDLDTDALRNARAAIYPAHRLKPCPAEYRRKYSDDQLKDHLKIKDQIRNLVEFNQLNLHEQWPVTGPFDVIFYRNVLIYFGEEAKRSIVSRFVTLLRPGGSLYLGHSESMLGAHPDLINNGRTIYRKRS